MMFVKNYGAGLGATHPFVKFQVWGPLINSLPLEEGGGGGEKFCFKGPFLNDHRGKKGLK